MDKAGVRVAFKAAGLARVLKDLDAVMKPSIRLTAKAADEGSLQVGATKLGGLPDLPAGAVWPVWKGAPQSFIAQVRLEEAHPYDMEGVLPEKGMLWFFYDAKQETYGDNPADRGGWQVVYLDGDASGLQRREAPAGLPAEGLFKPCGVSFAQEMTLAQDPQLEIPNCDWTADEIHKYENLLATFPDAADRGKPHHRLLGNPDTIQDDMRSQCQLMSHGVTGENDARAKVLLKGAMDWRLLLQVDSDDQAGMRWASSGMLYYWINKADLDARNFGGIWMVLQSE